LGSGRFAPWQPLTHVFVQGRQVMVPLFGGLFLYFFLPPLEESYTNRQLGEAYLAAFIGGIVVAFFLDVIGLTGRPAMGWSTIAVASAVLFGLTLPQATVNLWMILPVTAQWFVWGSLALAVLSIFSGGGLYGGEHLGAWAGMYGWYEYRGPGSYVRARRREAAAIEAELNRFTVIEGGLSDDPQDSDNREDWIH